jgi:hypothetical protein
MEKGLIVSPCVWLGCCAYLRVTVAEADSHRGARDAVRCGDRDREVRRKQNSENRAELHREP